MKFYTTVIDKRFSKKQNIKEETYNFTRNTAMKCFVIEAVVRVYQSLYIKTYTEPNT